MAYRPNAARAVRGYGSGTVSTTSYPAPGGRVWCVILAERDLGDTVPAWTDSYVANTKGFPPPSFMKRVASRVVWDRTRGREFHFRDEAHAERIAADARDES